MNTLLLFLTYDCNLNCSYCYQFHTSKTMTFSTAQKGVDLLLSCNVDKVNLDLYGGEPFLCFDLMKDIITYAAYRAHRFRKKISFRTTTNGILLRDAQLEFLSQYGVDITISIDGTQHAHEVCRGSASFKSAMNALSKLHRYPLIPITVNSVISPRNVPYFAESMKYLIDQGIRNIHISFDYESKWEKSHLSQSMISTSFKYLKAMGCLFSPRCIPP